MTTPSLCELYGQGIIVTPRGVRVVAPSEPTEWPGYELAFQEQLPPDWWLGRFPRHCRVLVEGQLIPPRVVGRCGDVAWKAERINVQTEAGEEVAYYSLELVP